MSDDRQRGNSARYAGDVCGEDVTDWLLSRAKGGK